MATFLFHTEEVVMWIFELHVRKKFIVIHMSKVSDKN